MSYKPGDIVTGTNLNVGTQIGAAIRPNSYDDDIPSVLASEIRGGHQTCKGLTGVDNPEGDTFLYNIKSSRREIGMVVFVEDEDTLYILKNGTDSDLDNNSNWEILETGSGGATFNGTQNYVSKFGLNGETIEDSNIYDDGNVGIGTETPGSKLDVNGNTIIRGDLTVQGTTTTIDSEEVTTKDNIIVLNNGEVGAGVTKGTAGIEVDRGTENNYQFVFDEADAAFKIGEPYGSDINPLVLSLWNKAGTINNNGDGVTFQPIGSNFIYLSGTGIIGTNYRTRFYAKSTVDGDKISVYNGSNASQKFTLTTEYAWYEFEQVSDSTTFYIQGVVGTGIISVDECIIQEVNLMQIVATRDNNLTDNIVPRFDSNSFKLVDSSITVLDNGNVGIGTDTPSYKLDVDATEVRAGGLIIGEQNTTGYVGLRNENLASILYGFQQNSAGITNFNGSQLNFRNYDVDKMVLRNGNLGIGTSYPSKTLDVGGNFNFTPVIAVDVLNMVATPSGYTSTNGLDNGVYHYQIIYETVDGETGNGVYRDISAEIVDNTTINQIELSNIPVPTDVRVVSKQIWRTIVNQAHYYSYYLTTVNNSVTEWVDDGSITLDTSGLKYYRKANTTAGLFSSTGNLFLQATDIYHTTLGVGAGANNTIGNSFVFIGGNAGRANTSGVNSTFVGYNCGVQNTTGSNNVAMGYSTLSTNTTGSQNVGIGYYSLNGDNGNFLSYNTAVGSNTLSGLKSGSYYNTAIGYKAGSVSDTTTGAIVSNTFIGSHTSSYIFKAGANNTFIGVNADAPNALTNNFLNLGNSMFATNFNTNVTPGGVSTDTKFGIGTMEPEATLHVVGDIKASKITGEVYYDKIIDASGDGDYDNITTAVNTEGTYTSFFIRDGEYIMDGDINLKEGQSLIGESQRGTIINQNNTTLDITIAYNNVALKNFSYINGRSTGGNIYLASATNTLIDNLYIDSGDVYTNIPNYGSGIKLTGCIDTTIMNTTVKGYIYNFAIEGSYRTKLSNLTSLGGNYGIRFRQSTYSVVGNIVIDDCVNGVYLRESSYGVYDGIIINTPTGTALYFYTSGDSLYNSFSDISGEANVAARITDCTHNNTFNSINIPGNLQVYGNNNKFISSTFGIGTIYSTANNTLINSCEFSSLTDDGINTSISSSVFPTIENVLNQTGYVGIGTDSPAYDLDVHGTNGIVNIEGAAPRFLLTDTSGDKGWQVRAYNDDLSFWGNNANSKYVTFQDGGNVGIGTESPNEKLTVAGNILLGSGNAVYFGDTGTGFYGSASADYLRFLTAGTTKMAIDTSGNVGIGTTSPIGKLNVSDGDIRMSDGYAIRATGYGNNQIKFEADHNVLLESYKAIRFSNYSGGSYNEKMRIDAVTGNVGIGTTAPKSKMHIYNGASGAEPYSNSHLVIENSSRSILSLLAPNSGDNYIMFGSPAASNRAYIGYSNSASPDPDAFSIKSAGKMVLYADNLGIGTSTPDSKLVVQGNTVKFLSEGGEERFIFTANTDGGSGRMLINDSQEDSKVSFNTNPSQPSYIDAGNVGIGTDTPLGKLHISGGTGSLDTGLVFGDGDTGLYENSDDNLYLKAGNTLSFLFTNNSNQSRGIIPLSNSTYDLGSTTRYWEDAYINNINTDVINSTNGLNINGNLKTTGSVTTNYRIISGDDVLRADDYAVEVDVENVIITLPSAVGIIGMKYEIDNSSTGNILIDSIGGTINGETTQTLHSDENIVVQSNGTNWRIK